MEEFRNGGKHNPDPEALSWFLSSVSSVVGRVFPLDPAAPESPSSIHKRLACEKCGIDQGSLTPQQKRLASPNKIIGSTLPKTTHAFARTEETLEIGKFWGGGRDVQ